MNARSGGGSPNQIITVQLTNVMILFHLHELESCKGWVLVISEVADMRKAPISHDLCPRAATALL
jgi:hypothetical protein